MNWRKKIILQWAIPTIRKKGELYKHYKEILSLEFLSKEEIKNYQEDKLKKILTYAYQNVPYYKEALKPLFNKEEIDLSKFNSIPLLTKDILRKEKERMYSSVYPKNETYDETSGGSTGEPVLILHDKTFWSKNMAIKLYYNHVLGKEFGDRELKLWGSERDIFKGSIGIKAKIDNFFYNRLLLNSFKMTPERMKEYAKSWNKFKPVSVWAYVDSIYEFARFVQKENIQLHPPKAVLVTAGTLTTEIKNFVEEVLKTKVYNQYGSREVGDMACECPEQEGLHILEFAHYLEVLDNKGNPVKPGELGEIVVTCLNNYAMPLIRYKIGDTGILSKKSPQCGRNYVLLEKVSGRVTDHFKKRDGTILHGEYFTHLFYFKKGIEKFQVIQKEFEKVVCLIVKKQEEELSKEELEDIKNKIKLVMGDNCKVEFEFVDEIPATNSGKYRYTLSEVAE